VSEVESEMKKSLIQIAPLCANNKILNLNFLFHSLRILYFICSAAHAAIKKNGWKENERNNFIKNLANVFS
jgi:hypothetical protein